MKHDELQRVRPGFDDLAHGSQAVFRCALDALSRPGRAVAVPAVAPHPGVGHTAAALLLLAVLDNDCTLWLSPHLAGSDAEAWLRFHTGCRVVADPAAARFAWLAAGDAWPPLAAFHAGTDLDPDQAATCVVEVDLPAAASAGTQAWRLQGPGIRDTETLHTRGLGADRVEQLGREIYDRFLAQRVRRDGLEIVRRARRDGKDRAERHRDHFLHRLLHHHRELRVHPREESAVEVVDLDPALKDSLFPDQSSIDETDLRLPLSRPIGHRPEDDRFFQGALEESCEI